MKWIDVNKMTQHECNKIKKLYLDRSKHKKEIVSMLSHYVL